MKYYIVTKVKAFGKNDIKGYRVEKIKETERYIEIEVWHETSYNGGSAYKLRIPWEKIEKIEIYK